MNRNQLRKVLEFVGAILLIQGGMGLVQAFTGRVGWGLIGHIGFLEGREVYGSIALVVLAIAVLAAAESDPKK
jgi:hypothetical protein